MKQNRIMRLFVSIALSMGSLSVFAQTQVTGHVYDNAGEPLIGASVMIQGTTVGAITDIDGAYSISVRSSDILVAEYLGFMPSTETVGTRKIGRAHV